MPIYRNGIEQNFYRNGVPQNVYKDGILYGKAAKEWVYAAAGVVVFSDSIEDFNNGIITHVVEREVLPRIVKCKGMYYSSDVSISGTNVSIFNKEDSYFFNGNPSIFFDRNSNLYSSIASIFTSLDGQRVYGFTRRIVSSGFTSDLYRIESPTNWRWVGSVPGQAYAACAIPLLGGVRLTSNNSNRSWIFTNDENLIEHRSNLGLYGVNLTTDGRYLLQSESPYLVYNIAKDQEIVDTSGMVGNPVAMYNDPNEGLCIFSIINGNSTTAYKAGLARIRYDEETRTATLLERQDAILGTLYVPFVRVFYNNMNRNEEITIIGMNSGAASTSVLFIKKDGSYSVRLKSDTSFEPGFEFICWLPKN